MHTNFIYEEVSIISLLLTAYALYPIEIGYWVKNSINIIVSKEKRKIAKACIINDYKIIEKKD